MFDKIHKDIDAVFIATPDHHHAVASIMAMKLGKHVYCEKPLAHSIGEVRLMMETARKCKVMTQLGNQGHSSEYIRVLCEYIWAGAIGDVTETYSWAPTGRGGSGGRLPTKPVPAGLHWDEWIGPHAVPRLPRGAASLAMAFVVGVRRRLGGRLGLPQPGRPVHGPELGAPTSIEAVAQFGGSRERFPLRNAIRWDFPARGDMPPVKVLWYDGYFGATDPLAHDEAAGLKQNRPPIVDELEKNTAATSTTAARSTSATKGIMHTGNYAPIHGSSPKKR